MSRFHFQVEFWPVYIGALVGVFCHNRTIVVPNLADVSGLFSVSYEVILMAHNAGKIALWELYFCVYSIICL